MSLGDVKGRSDVFSWPGFALSEERVE